MRSYTWFRYGDAIISDTQRIVQYRTYQAEIPNRENPEFIRMSGFLKQKSDELGFKFRNYDNYGIDIRPGLGSPLLGFFAHGDVVPADEKNWKYEPFSGILVDGQIHGRGTVDDKSPVIAMLYVMKA